MGWSQRKMKKPKVSYKDRAKSKGEKRGTRESEGLELRKKFKN